MSEKTCDMGFADPPEDWPCNEREIYLEAVFQTLSEFINDPTPCTQERLVSLVATHDFSQVGLKGRIRISLYEISLLNCFGFFARQYRIWSLLMFVYGSLSTMLILDRGLERILSELQNNSFNDWSSYRYLMRQFKLYYQALDSYKANQDEDFVVSIEHIIDKWIAEFPNNVIDICNILVELTLDMSSIIGTKHEDQIKFSRDQLKRLFKLEAKLLKMAGVNPSSHPYVGKLRVQISNYILKSRNDYNQDYICKYIKNEALLNSIATSEVWVRDIAKLNDPLEGAVVRGLFEDSSWLEYDWAKRIDTRPSRTYYVACFSKSIENPVAVQRYGDFLIGFKNDRLADLLAPITHCKFYRVKERGHHSQEAFFRPMLAQALVFDVLYGEDKVKDELKYLCDIIDLFEMTNDEKHDFLERIIQYWLYSAKVAGNDWESERERRYVLFTYPNEYKYPFSRIEGDFFKTNSKAFTYPDFIRDYGANDSNKDCRIEIKKQTDEKLKRCALQPYFRCDTCLNVDYDLAKREVKCCPICGGTKYKIIEP